MAQDEGRRYRDYKIYCCIALNRLVSAMRINLYQEGLEARIGNLLNTIDYTVTKADIMHEIRSNHKMTSKVLRDLEEDGFVAIAKGERGYNIKITKEGIMHIRKYNEFYARLYKRQLEDLYAFREPLPSLRAYRRE